MNGPVTIDNTGGFTLTMNAGNYGTALDLSSADHDVTIQGPITRANHTTYHLGPAGRTLTLSGGSSGGNHFRITGSGGALNIPGETVTAGGYSLNVGYNGDVSVDLTGSSSVLWANDVLIGQNGSGTVNVVDGYFYAEDINRIGVNSGGYGAVHVSGGRYLLNAWNNRLTHVGYNGGSGAITVSGTGVVELGRSGYGGNRIELGHGLGTGALHINGGEFVIYSTSSDAIKLGTGTGNIYFNGGLFKATTTQNPAAGIATVVQAGGAAIEVTSGRTLTFNSGLTEDPESTGGGLTKTGAGTLVLNGTNTYSGDTSVEAGTLTLARAGMGDTSEVSISSGATLNLTFAGSDVVESLVLDGVSQAFGTYDASNSGGLITGSGSIQVIPASVPLDLRVSLATDPVSQGNPGRDVVATVTLENLSALPGYDITLSALRDVDTTLVSISDDGTSSGLGINWTIAELAASGTVTRTFTFKPSALGTLTNQVSIEASNEAVDPSTWYATNTLDVICLDEALSSMGFDNMPAVVSGVEGAPINFGVSAFIDGCIPDGISLSMIASPAGASFTQTGLSGVYRQGAFSWTPGDLTAGSYFATFSAQSGGLSNQWSVLLNITEAPSTNDYQATLDYANNATNTLQWRTEVGDNDLTFNGDKVVFTPTGLVGAPYAYGFGGAGEPGYASAGTGWNSMGARSNATYEIWFKPRLVDTRQALINYGDDDQGFAMTLEADNRVQARFTEGTNVLTVTSAASSIASGTWYQAVVVFDSQSESHSMATLYLDAVQVDQETVGVRLNYAGAGEGRLGAAGELIMANDFENVATGTYDANTGQAFGDDALLGNATGNVDGDVVDSGDTIGSRSFADTSDPTVRSRSTADTTKETSFSFYYRSNGRAGSNTRAAAGWSAIQSDNINVWSGASSDRVLIGVGGQGRFVYTPNIQSATELPDSPTIPSVDNNWYHLSFSMKYNGDSTWTVSELTVVEYGSDGVTATGNSWTYNNGDPYTFDPGCGATLDTTTDAYAYLFTNRDRGSDGMDNILVAIPGLSFNGEIAVARMFNKALSASGVEAVHSAIRSAPVSLVVTASGPTQVAPFSSYIMSVRVANTGANSAGEVVLTAGLDDQLDFIRATAPRTLSGTNVQWNIGALAPGQQAVRTVTVRPDAAGTFSSIFTVTSAMDNANDLSNWSDDVVVVAECNGTDLPVFGPLPHQAGSVDIPMTFTIYGGVDGCVPDLLDTSEPVTANLPEGAQISSPGVINGQYVEWLFSWTPSSGQEGTHPVQISITDGVATSTATVLLHVDVDSSTQATWSPSIENTTAPTGGMAGLTWQASPGLKYVVYSADDYAGSGSVNWSVEGTVQASSNRASLHGLDAGTSRRYYQVALAGQDPAEHRVWGVIQPDIPSSLSFMAPPLAGTDRDFGGEFGTVMANALTALGTKIYIMSPGTGASDGQNNTLDWIILERVAEGWSRFGGGELPVLDEGQGFMVMNMGEASKPVFMGLVENTATNEVSLASGSLENPAFNIIGLSKGRSVPVSTAFTNVPVIGDYDENNADQVVILQTNGSWRRLIRRPDGTWYDTGRPNNPGETDLKLQPGEAYYYIRRGEAATLNF
ncbi:MAG: LamG-like jellyroll fold domain-containing protein [Kiritimatiellia bacterium]